MMFNKCYLPCYFQRTLFQSRTCGLESENAMPCKWCIYKQNVKFKAIFFKCISKRHYFPRALYCNVPQLDCDAQEGRTLVFNSGFPRHPLLSNVYVIEITTPRVTRTRNIIRDSVQSTAGLLK